MEQFNSVTILSIETSCDDTCVAVVKASGKKGPVFKILSNVISSQAKIHKKWGGVYPTLAKRAHQKNLVPVLIKALGEARILKIFNFQFSIFKQFSNPESQILNSIFSREPELLQQTISFLKSCQRPPIGAIAVTIGPGLEPCLWTGVNFARALAYWWGVPIIPVNHIEAHIMANFVGQCQISNLKSQIFPAICLVVSGGHTQLILMKKIGDYKIIGETRDDAAGECFDKTARILGLGYPGGPAIAHQASSFWRDRVKMRSMKTRGLKELTITLPRPMLNSKDYDFSFSGLKTAVLYDFQKRSPQTRKSRKYITTIAKEIQQAVIDVLIKKTSKAALDYRAKTIILAGGVAANDELRKQFKCQLPTPKDQTLNVLSARPTGQTANCQLNFLVPPKNLCTDNAAMVAVAGYYQWLRKKIAGWKKMRAEANLRINSKTKSQNTHCSHAAK